MKKVHGYKSIVMEKHLHFLIETVEEDIGKMLFRVYTFSLTI